jgi:hypothetical protein
MDSENAHRVIGLRHTKALELRKDFVEESFGLQGLEFEVVMGRMKPKHTVANQRQRLERWYFREWDCLEHLLEGILAIKASSFVRQDKLTIVADPFAPTHFFTNPAFEMACERFTWHKLLLSERPDVLLPVHALFLSLHSSSFHLQEL